MLRMVQRREHFALRAENARADRDQPASDGGQDLDRDLTFQLRVGRPIHLPHSAFADLRGDFVDAEAGAGSEGQVRCGLYEAERRARTNTSLPDALRLLKARRRQSPDGDRCTSRVASSCCGVYETTSSEAPPQTAEKREAGVAPPR